MDIVHKFEIELILKTHKLLEKAAFNLESLAHVRHREQELLPIVEELKDIAEALTHTPVRRIRLDSLTTVDRITMLNVVDELLEVEENEEELTRLQNLRNKLLENPTL
jgi:hypothetical protein